MRPHDWIVESVDADAIGPTDFWKCRVCRVGGGPVAWGKKKDGPDRVPFIPGKGSMGYSREQMEDCDFTSVLTTMEG